MHKKKRRRQQSTAHPEWILAVITGSISGIVSGLFIMVVAHLLNW